MRKAGRRRAIALEITLVLLAAGGSPRAQRDTLLIGDFDAGKAETKSGLSLWPFCDEQYGGTSQARVSLIHPGADGSAGALRISFRITGDFPTPFAGAWAMVGPEGLVTDLSAYRGVRFYARAKDASAFTAGIVRFPGQLKRYTAPFTVGEGWTLVELPFDKFQLVAAPGAPSADTSPLDAKDITSVGVAIVSKLRGEFALDIDRIEFYR
jgi:Complex I intermediate-associated protein 30 (CIA30)